MFVQPYEARGYRIEQCSFLKDPPWPYLRIDHRYGLNRESPKGSYFKSPGG